MQYYMYAYRHTYILRLLEILYFSLLAGYAAEFLFPQWVEVDSDAIRFSVSFIRAHIRRWNPYHRSCLLYICYCKLTVTIFQ